MIEIVSAEGPITANRAYSLYNKASGGKKLTSIARAPLSSSAYWLAQERKLTLVKKDDIPWQGDDVLRMPDQPAVRVRELGPRDLDEVPLDEIAELVRRIRGASGTTDAAEMKRAVLNAYGLRRLTSKADEYLGLAIDLSEDSGRAVALGLVLGFGVRGWDPGSPARPASPYSAVSRCDSGSSLMPSSRASECCPCPAFSTSSCSACSKPSASPPPAS